MPRRQAAAIEFFPRPRLFNRTSQGLGQNQNARLFEKFFSRNAFGRHVSVVGDDEVELALKQSLIQKTRRHDDDVEARDLGQHLTDDRHAQRGRQRFGDTDAKRGLNQVVLADLREQLLRVVEHARDVATKHQRFGRRFHRAARTIEQRKAQVFFQFENGFGDSRLRNVQGTSNS